MPRQPPDQRRLDSVARPGHREEHRHVEQLHHDCIFERLGRFRRAHFGDHALVGIDRPVDARLAVVPCLVPRGPDARCLVRIIGVLYRVVAVIVVLKMHQARERERKDDRDRRDLADPFVDPAMFATGPRDIVVHGLVRGNVTGGGDKGRDRESHPDRHDVQHGQRKQRQPDGVTAPCRGDIAPHRAAMILRGDLAFFLQQLDPCVAIEFCRSAERDCGTIAGSFPTRCQRLAIVAVRGADIEIDTFGPAYRWMNGVMVGHIQRPRTVA